MNSTIDDVDSSVAYSTSPAWNTNVWADQRPQPYLGTNHGTPNPGAVATFTFTGTAVYVYGFKAGDHGFRAVSIDGASPVTCDGRTGSQGSRALVYWAAGLSQGRHEITLQHTGTQGQYLNIDYFVVTNSDTTGSNSQTTRDSTATVAGNNPAYTSSAQDNNTQSSSSIGIIVGAVVGAVGLALLAAVWYLYRRRRKVRERPEKHGRVDLDGGTALMAGVAPDPRAIEPFYSPVHNPGQPPPNSRLMFNQQQRQPYPESSSGYYSGARPQSTYSSVPTAYSPPPNQTRFEPMSSQAPTTTTGSAHASAESRPVPWASSDVGETTSETSQQPVGDPSMSKARYSGANSLGASSTSRPLSPPLIDDTIPPPKYEL